MVHSQWPGPGRHQPNVYIYVTFDKSHEIISMSRINHADPVPTLKYRTYGLIKGIIKYQL